MLAEIIDTPHGRYWREWVDLTTMRAWFAHDLRQVRVWTWRRDESGTVWFALYH